jgi:xanthine dehydrogenase YagT iron-sulfur-binding subunit
MSDPQHQDKNGAGLSRRAFLKGSGVSAAAAGALGTLALPVAESQAQPAGQVVQRGPGPVEVRLTVNGQQTTANVEPRVTLLDALRNHMDVTGCKKVCDRGTCGACTVVLNNKVVYSCTMLAVEADGGQVRTAEALLQNGQLNAVPAAFVQFDAQQCGFCTAGFVVAMRAVLDANAQATPADIEKGLAGNICRCGTYEQMRDAIYHVCNQTREH